MLVHRRGGGFKIIQQDECFFRGNDLAARGSAHLTDYLLVILHVQGVLRFNLRQLLIKIAGSREISGLHAGMGQQFHHFADVAGVA